MKNLSKLYYKDYYKDFNFTLDPSGKIKVLNENLIVEKNREILNLADQEYLNQAKGVFAFPCFNNEDYKSFNLEVAYPGLITGIGLEHEAKIEGELKLGIHLDYTSGLPVIYGSSVKGILRNAFDFENLFEFLKEFFSFQKAKIEYLENKFKRMKMNEWSKILFGNKNEEGKDERSVYERDIFFDAIIEAPARSGKMLSVDSITPHGSNPLKNPTPITFIRIASGCIIKFRFILHDTETVTAEDKKDLYKYILMAFGAGAKTSVGYGRFLQKDK